MATINVIKARRLLGEFEFKTLFIEELGWARTKRRVENCSIDGEAFRLVSVAEQGGMEVFVVTSTHGDLPGPEVRRKIERHVTKSLAHEHILVFVDQTATTSVWQWVKRQEGVSDKAREHKFSRGQTGEALLQKLRGIAFGIDELDDEGQVGIGQVAARVSKAFDVERITKRFYDGFKEEHDRFLKFIKGIDGASEREWYASVMLNRLMFVYFIQKKGFLDGNPDYLAQKLAESRESGKDQFYQQFLSQLFFEGFALEEKDRSPKARLTLGKIPYLNGGLFQQHAIELKNGGGIRIPDAVFERLFDFFNTYQWHLDERPLRADNEINPDVLGYIFEKYINQKQMGAYYTKEDITGYICRNTILPFLIDKIQVLQPSARFDFLSGDAATYVHPAAAHAGPLPTETEQDQSSRSRWVAAVQDAAKREGVGTVNDFVAYNLDLERAVQDWLRGLDNPSILRDFYFSCLCELTVLDPTVGSGAFLFAAMNVLEPLYMICLDKMETYAGESLPAFREELTRIDRHANRRYFIFKSIIINNLYGVDLMAEATEICKLRLFLKLVAQVGDVAQIEPLPDIDFNIRPGNSLVGYASTEEIGRAAARSIFNINLPARIDEADAELRSYRDLQTSLEASARVIAKAKSHIKSTMQAISAELDESLRVEYGAVSLAEFQASYQPFHWHLEFNRIMQAGGFDVVVGNPPYVEYKSIKGNYMIRGYETEPCGNLYAFTTERAFDLLRQGGRFGMIIPVASLCTDGYATLQDILKRQRVLHTSFYNDRPGKLFDGLEHIRLTIILAQSGSGGSTPRVFTTKYNKWFSEFRPYLFETIRYIDSTGFLKSGSFAKIETDTEASILAKLKRNTRTVSAFATSEGSHRIFYTRKLSHFVQVLDFIPKIVDSKGQRRPPSELKDFSFEDKTFRDAFLALYNSSLFYWFLTIYSDCRNLNRRELEAVPLDVDRIEHKTIKRLAELSGKLMADFRKYSQIVPMRYEGMGTLNIQCIYPRHSKTIIDEIDQVLALHYGFTQMELDFLVDFDIKFRLGKDGGND